MNSLLNSGLEYEKVISTFEEKIHIPLSAPHSEKTLTWLFDNPTGLRPLVASLADKSDFDMTDAPLHLIPMTINYSKSVMVELFIDTPPKNKKFKVLSVEEGWPDEQEVEFKGRPGPGRLPAPLFGLD